MAVLKQRAKNTVGSQPNFAMVEESKLEGGVLLWFVWGEPLRADGNFVSSQHGRTVVSWSASLQPPMRDAVSKALTSVSCTKK